MPVTEAMAAFDSKPTSTTDRYQVLRPDDPIKINAILSSRLDNTSAIGYVLNAACPRTSILCNRNTLFATSILTVVMCINIPPFA